MEFDHSQTAGRRVGFVRQERSYSSVVVVVVSVWCAWSLDESWHSVLPYVPSGKHMFRTTV